MLIYAGIDEAGYGPMFGPLCIASTCFVLPEHDPVDGAPDLWITLSGAVCRSRRDGKHRLPIDDSKKLKGQKRTKSRDELRGSAQHPLWHLERGVLAFHSQLPDEDHTFDALTDESLLTKLGGVLPQLPWYDGSVELPEASDVGTLRIAAARLERTLSDSGVRCARMRCTVVDAGDLNREAGKLGTKAGVNMHAITQLIDDLRCTWPHEHPRVIVDRQSGRSRYRDELLMAFPGSQVDIIAEEHDFSRYRMTIEGSTLTITFCKGAEERHLPVALASMTAKYVRELLMIRLNGFFRSHLPELKPTAGYVQDGRRYLEEINPIIRRLGLPRDELVRRT